MNKTIDGYFNDEDFEDITDDLGQEDYLGDDEGPSLHLVIPFYQKLLNDYSSYSKLIASTKKKKPSLFQNSFVLYYL